MVHHEIGARSEGRAKRPREQAVGVEMEIANQPNKSSTSQGGGDDSKIQAEPCSNQPIDGDRLSGESRRESYKSRNSPKQVTDDSCESEDTEKGKPSNESSSLQGKAHDWLPQHRQTCRYKQEGRGNDQQHKESEMKGTEPVAEDDQQSSLSLDPSPTLPQHERIQHVEPLDINYRSTPACLKLREALTSRLRFVAPTGRIQVVSNINQL